ncbi:MULTISPECIES: YhjD/YihY/BrkB family envelope integrity protein [Rhodococcus]|uniref:YhjD/YihY/BrkB family envelope integrity protein n=1 Tax=Rhodococcus TaxID=1827 RepID=UPI001E3EB776|nr:YhjD/YihY/BrkB family envelope integrity protein [Rhodococcus pyridinivorans]MCD2119177.1 YihY/virulence factor BrkB family protein [Rhodococcus pyridinivorans]MCZ4627656.1 YihY/virulence factor BrkB family protein [Rhodococcus pyridinivorans]MCZ4648739.1 YihY/virulence factor BrkB family protein [Rhodococcus pyridinivorans]MDJ0481409.1 YhjD/YihY/BrkB family envelope integrity protein [Rhodococcus pyridinivorans]MDV7254973.1 YhjD/YihY/BrkB family envelope integrity protein [Rhodococcus pyri
MAGEPDEKPGFLERQRAAHPVLDRILRAGVRYQENKGDYYAAGLTYFTVLAIVPIIMVVFSLAGFVLAGRPELLDGIRQVISENIPGQLGGTVQSLIDSAIESRGAVGLIGLLTASYAGLGWITNLREALTAMWEHPRDKGNFFVVKLRDGGALLSLGLAMTVSLGLSALSSGPIARRIVELLNMENLVGIGVGLRILALVAATAATGLVFTWVIARLPREPVPFRSALVAGAIAGIGFELLKQTGSIYLERVLNGPAGVAFGPILGILVFGNLTARLVLFCTAFAATSRASLALAHHPAPTGAVITPRLEVHEGLDARRGAAILGAGLVGGLLAGLRFRRK